ncbi:MAG: hypothetical protein K0B10_09180 [Vicingaceae bacterium]|nr:hypothetical protein [Vicingaceae bacterium]
MSKETLIRDWEEAQLMVKERFGEKLDEQTILYIIGLQELKKPYTNYTKEEKLDIIHIGICTVLSRYGYYQSIGLDDERWPHFKNSKKIPNEIEGKNQTTLIRRGIIDYFNENTKL